MRKFLGHAGYVTCLAFSTPTPPASVISWNSAGEREVGGWSEMEMDQEEVEGKGEGLVMFSGSVDWSVIQWDVASGSIMRKLTGFSNTVNAVYFFEGMLVTTSSDREVRQWNVSTGQVVWSYLCRLNSMRGSAMRFDSGSGGGGGNGSRAATLFACSAGESYKLDVWNMRTRLRLSTLGLDVTSPVSHIAVTQSDLYVAATDRIFRQLSLLNDSFRFEYVISSPIRAMRVSAETGHLFTGTDDMSIRVFDTVKTQSVRRLDGSWGWVTAIWVTKRSIIVGYDANIYRQWWRQTGELDLVMGSHGNKVTSVTATDEYVISGCLDRVVRVFTYSGRLVMALYGSAGSVRSVYALEDSVFAAGDDLVVRQYSLTNFTSVFNYTGHVDSVTSVLAYRSTRGVLVVSASLDTKVMVFNASSGETVNRLVGHDGAVTSLAVDEQANIIFSGSEDLSIILWDVLGGNQIGDFILEAPVRSLAYCAGFLFAAADDMFVRQWHVSSGTLRRVYTGHLSTIQTVFVAQGQLLTGSKDGQIMLWDIPDLAGEIPGTRPTTALPDPSHTNDGGDGGGSNPPTPNTRIFPIKPPGASTRATSVAPEAKKEDVQQDGTVVLVSIAVAALGFIVFGYFVLKTVRKSSSTRRPRLRRAQDSQAVLIGDSNISLNTGPFSSKSGSRLFFPDSGGLMTPGSGIPIASPFSSKTTSSTKKFFPDVENIAGMTVPTFMEKRMGAEFYQSDFVAKTPRGCKLFHAVLQEEEMKENCGKSGAIIRNYGKSLNSMSENLRTAFYTEVAIMWKFRHKPFITPLFAYCGSPVSLVTRYYVLGDLAGFIHGNAKSNKLFPYTKRNMQQIIGGISKALQVLHQEGVIYNDLCPSNVQLDVDEVDASVLIPVFSDFRRARIVDTTRKDGAESGLIWEPRDVTMDASICYCGPEVFKRARSHNILGTFKLSEWKASDVYSISIIMLEMMQRRDAWSIKST